MLIVVASSSHELGPVDDVAPNRLAVVDERIVARAGGNNPTAGLVGASVGEEVEIAQRLVVSEDAS